MQKSMIERRQGERRSSSRVSGVDPWRTLEALSFYRATVCIAMLALMASQYRPAIFGSLHPLWLDVTLYVYLFIAALLLIMARGQRPNAAWQASIQIAVDLAAITVMVYTSNGINSGLGTLLVTPVAAGSLLLDRRLGVLPPAIAALLLLGVEITLNLRLVEYAENFTQTGILGAVLFVLAMTGGALARRARESEARAFRAESDLVKLSQLGETVIQRMQAGVLVVDSHGRIELLNRAASGLLGETAAPGSELATCAPQIWSQLQTWRFDPAAIRNSAIQLADGQKAWAQFTRLGRGSDAANLVVLDDASRVAEQAQAMKLASLGRLTASIAHELRNPLAAIRHASDLLDESQHITADDRPLLAIVQRQTDRLNAIITSILGLSSKPREPADSVDLGESLRTGINEFMVHQSDPLPIISLELKPQQIPVRVDPMHLSQIVQNLLENACKHGRRRDRDLRISLSASLNTEAQEIWLDVSDNGPGISRDAAGHIFEPFFSTRHGGTGLGLYITRELCDAAGGSLQLVPQEDGSGAFFRVTLPAAALSRAA